jgi:hypothetical protein
MARWTLASAFRQNLRARAWRTIQADWRVRKRHQGGAVRDLVEHWREREATILR